MRAVMHFEDNKMQPIVDPVPADNKEHTAHSIFFSGVYKGCELNTVIEWLPVSPTFMH